MDVRHVRFRHLPAEREATGDVRERVLAAELLRHLSSAPTLDRLLLFAQDEVLWADLDELLDHPGAGTALARSLVDEGMVRRAFRTGRIGDRLAVLETRQGGGWWLATCPSNADEIEWTETEGYGPLPDPITAWWPLQTPPADLRIVAHRLTTDPCIHQTDRPPVRTGPGWRDVVEALPALLADTRPDALAFSVAGDELRAWRIPRHHIGGVDEAMRCIATATDAHLVGAVRVPDVAMGASLRHVAELLLEVEGHRHTALLGMLDGRVVLLDHRDLGPVAQTDSWLGRRPTAQRLSLLGAVGCPVPSA